MLIAYIRKAKYVSDGIIVVWGHSWTIVPYNVADAMFFVGGRYENFKVG